MTDKAFSVAPGSRHSRELSPWVRVRQTDRQREKSEIEKRERDRAERETEGRERD